MILSGVFTTPPLYSLDPAPDGESETRRLEISFQLFQWIQKSRLKHLNYLKVCNFYDFKIFYSQKAIAASVWCIVH